MKKHLVFFCFLFILVFSGVLFAQSGRVTSKITNKTLTQTESSSTTPVNTVNPQTSNNNSTTRQTVTGTIDSGKITVQMDVPTSVTMNNPELEQLRKDLLLKASGGGALAGGKAGESAGRKAGESAGKKAGEEAGATAGAIAAEKKVEELRPKIIEDVKKVITEGEAKIREGKDLEHEGRLVKVESDVGWGFWFGLAGGIFGFLALLLAAWALASRSNVPRTSQAVNPNTPNVNPQPVQNVNIPQQQAPPVQPPPVVNANQPVQAVVGANLKPSLFSRIVGALKGKKQNQNQQPQGPIQAPAGNYINIGQPNPVNQPVPPAPNVQPVPVPANQPAGVI